MIESAVIVAVLGVAWWSGWAIENGYGLPALFVEALDELASNTRRMLVRKGLVASRVVDLEWGIRQLGRVFEDAKAVMRDLTTAIESLTKWR